MTGIALRMVKATFNNPIGAFLALGLGFIVGMIFGMFTE